MAKAELGALKALSDRDALSCSRSVKNSPSSPVPSPAGQPAKRTDVAGR